MTPTETIRGLPAQPSTPEPRNDRFATGTQHGRWTIVRRATPAHRDGCLRERVLCRCVCNTEHIVWLGDLQRGRSKGCKLASCRHRHKAVQALAPLLPHREMRLLKKEAAEKEVPITRLLTQAIDKMLSRP